MKKETKAVKDFLELLKTSKDLQDKIVNNNNAYVEANPVPAADSGSDVLATYKKQATEAVVIPVAKEAGFDFTIDDLMAYEHELTTISDQELNSDELAAVAAGDGTGGFLCGGLGLGFGQVRLDNDYDKCFILGFGVGACFISGSSV